MRDSQIQMQDTIYTRNITKNSDPMRQRLTAEEIKYKTPEIADYSSFPFCAFAFFSAFRLSFFNLFLSSLSIVACSPSCS